MQINSNFTAKAGALNGPSSKMQAANQAAGNLLNQISPANNAYKTPSMAFLENKRREEEKQMN
jgi:ribosome-binding factor A